MGAIRQVDSRVSLPACAAVSRRVVLWETTRRGGPNLLLGRNVGQRAAVSAGPPPAHALAPG